MGLLATDMTLSRTCSVGVCGGGGEAPPGPCGGRGGAPGLGAVGGAGGAKKSTRRQKCLPASH